MNKGQLIVDNEEGTIDNEKLSTAHSKSSIKMKDSGIAWIGEIPEYWKVKRLKDLASIMGGKDFKKVVSEKGYPVYGSGGPFEIANTYMYDKLSVLLGRKGTIDKPIFVTKPFRVVDTMDLSVGYWMLKTGEKGETAINPQYIRSSVVKN